MTPAARFAALMELTDLLLAEWQRPQPRPAELALKAYTRERRYMGGGDRKALQEALFGLLRGLGAAKGKCAAAGLPENGRSLCLAYVGAEAEALCEGGKYAPAPLSELELKMIHSPLATHHSPLPEWLDTLLRAQYGEEAEALMAALMLPATLDLRVNRLKATAAEAQQSLAAEGIETTPIDGLPDALEAPRHAPVMQSQAYLQGWVEVQDRGSQAVVAGLLGTGHWALGIGEGITEQAPVGERSLGGQQADPALSVSKANSPSRSQETERGQLKIIDYCAGGGGKSLALASMLGDAAQIIAWDVEPARLAQLAPRAERAGAKNISLWTQAPEKLPEADLVILDVPCSGMGTIRRHPDLPWRLTPEKVKHYQQLQKIILRQGAQKVKKGGFLLYVTCSLLESENFQCVNDFLTDYSHFRVVTLPQIWDKEPSKEALSLQFLPHKHASDGFYAALLQRET